MAGRDAAPELQRYGRTGAVLNNAIVLVRDAQGVRALQTAHVGGDDEAAGGELGLAQVGGDVGPRVRLRAQAIALPEGAVRMSWMPRAGSPRAAERASQPDACSMPVTACAECARSPLSCSRLPSQ